MSDGIVEYYFSRQDEEIAAKVFPFHVHNKLEMYILLEGDVSFAVESSLYRVSHGDAIITRPNEIHNCILNSDTVHRHMCFWFDTSNEFLYGDFLAHRFGENNLIVPDAPSKQRLLEIYDALQEASIKKDAYAQQYLILEMLAIFRRFVSSEATSNEMPPMLKTILGDIDKNLTTIRSLDYFTEKYYVSSSTLNRLFKKHLRTTPKMYIESKRLSYSRLLLNSGKSVLAACMEAGFPDYSNYIRLFKRRFEITPKQYKDSKSRSTINYNMNEGKQ